MPVASLLRLTTDLETDSSVYLAVEFVCGSWGDQNLPTEPAHLRGFIESLQGIRPVPEWLLQTVETLAEVDELDGRCVVLECAVREW